MCAKRMSRPIASESTTWLTAVKPRVNALDVPLSRRATPTRPRWEPTSTCMIAGLQRDPGVVKEESRET